MLSDLKILAWDIERIPASGYHWGLFQQNIGINQLIQPGEMVSFAARWVDQPKRSVVFHSTFHDGKQRMLEELWKLQDDADALLSWNGAGFDTKHSNTEFILAGIKPPSPSVEIDLMRVAKKQFRFLSNKLDFVSQQLGVGAKVVHEGWGLWEKVMLDDPAAWARFKRYNEQDVHLLIDLYQHMLPWIHNHPNLNLYNGRGCPRCGVEGSLEKRGFRTTAIGKYQRYSCTSCGAWSSSGVRLDSADIR